MRLRRFAVLAVLPPLLAACATGPGPVSSAPAGPRCGDSAWAFQCSDIPVDPAFRFGQLDNGLRYVLRANATPRGTAIVRMEIKAGSLDESDDERGYAHFVEHMAFNGSTNVPEGDMVRLLEREGLAFGADTNASTTFTETNYQLDLPRAEPALLDRALMLMRETASELSFSQEAVDRERGVVLSEMRDRNTYALRNLEDSMQFQNPGALYARRLPIGTHESLRKATAASLRSFWEREYVPGHATVVVIGDFDPAVVEAGIRARFDDWRGSTPEPQPDAGPVDFADRARDDVFIDPALPERTEAIRNGPWQGGMDTIARRKENLLREIGYNIVNRRFQRISRQVSPPFRGAGFGTGDIFEAGRSTRLVVDTSDRQWRDGVIAAASAYRGALKYGFTKAEVAEQVAGIRAQLRNAAASADTRSHEELAQAIWLLLRDRLVPSDPRSVLERFERHASDITPGTVRAAMLREAVPLDEPLLRFRGRFEPAGGAEAVRAAWRAAMSANIGRDHAREALVFAYTNFGPAGTLTGDTTDPALGIRRLRFANGVMLNLKRTEIEKDRIALKVSIDGGAMQNRIGAPFAAELTPYLAEGGLGRHSEDELQTILAGKTVDNEFTAEDKALVALATTTPEDLALQLQVYAAYVTDPGYRPEGIERYRHDINRYFAQLTATPASALAARIGGIQSDNDPRFTLQEPEKYRALTYQQFAAGMADRLRNGALEIGLVGDFDENAAIAAVAATFGALPAREGAFSDHSDQPPRRFTANRAARVIRHTGPADQALVRLEWPTSDDSNPLVATILELLERVTRLELTDTLREALGKAYSPGASSRPSRAWAGYGTFAVSASVDLAEVPATRAAIRETIERLRSHPVEPDELLRARQPMIESIHNSLKSNSGWLSLVDRAQSEADRIDRYLTSEKRLVALTAQDILDAARKYLDPALALEITVIPQETHPPGP